MSMLAVVALALVLNLSAAHAAAAQPADASDVAVVIHQTAGYRLAGTAQRVGESLLVSGSLCRASGFSAFSPARIRLDVRLDGGITVPLDWAPLSHAMRPGATGCAFFRLQRAASLTRAEGLELTPAP